MKNILITGSTDGIGKLVAIKLANEGHKVYLHGRNKKKLEKAIEEVKNKTNNNEVSGFIGDLSDFDSVRNMINDIKSKVESLDILINNAGIFKSNATTKSGIDLRLVVNYISQYLLIEALIPLVQKGKEPRIINLSSAAQAPVSLKALTGKEKLGINEAYAQSKLALTMWSFDLAKKHQDINIIAVNPGSLLNTKMAKEAYGTHWSSADKGANILYDLAISNKYKNASGKYFDNDNGNFNQAHPDAYDNAKIAKLIKETQKILS